MQVIGPRLLRLYAPNAHTDADDTRRVHIASAAHGHHAWTQLAASMRRRYDAFFLRAALAALAARGLTLLAALPGALAVVLVVVLDLADPVAFVP